MKKLKILHGMSEVAGQNIYSVLGLREIGEEATSAVFIENSFMYSNDLNLHIDKNKIYLLPWYILKLTVFLIYALFKYNTFHFHYGHSIGNNVELFVYSLFNKKVFYEFHGSDMRNYIDFYKQHPEAAEETSEKAEEKQRKRNCYICSKADGIILHDDELIKYLPSKHAPIHVVPLRINLDAFKCFPPAINNDKIVVVHAPSKRAIKGTKYIISVVEELKIKYPNIEFILVEGKSQEEAKEIYAKADIIIDQMFIGTYGVFAIESMAMGKPVISYISDDMIQNFPEELPIVSANIHNLKEKLDYLINNPEQRNILGLSGRKYVEDYHDMKKIACVLKDIYNDTAPSETGRKAFNRVKNIHIADN